MRGFAGGAVEGCGAFEVGRYVTAHVEALHGGRRVAVSPYIGGFEFGNERVVVVVREWSAHKSRVLSMMSGL